MRNFLILAVAVAATFVAAAWWSNSTSADTRVIGAVSIDPIAMTLSSDDMPVQYYAAF
jgi:hypothetical protein